MPYKIHECIDYLYMINDNVLLFAGNEITDLCIVFDRQLNFHAHFDKMCCKALKTLGFRKSICNEFKLLTLVKFLYCAFVRSILEYGAVVQDPDTSCGMYQIECIQRIFLNFDVYKLKIDHPPHGYLQLCTVLALKCQLTEDLKLI